VRVLTAARVFSTSLHERGARGTLARLRRAAVNRRQERLKQRRDREFDEERGVETAGWVRVPELDTESPNRRYATSYEPSSVDEFRLLMGKLTVDPREFTFVDYGSGKGRALLLAAEYDFRRIVGVEFAESLVRIARENVAAAGDDSRIEMVVSDAIAYEPPAGPLVLYFFHPFAPAVLEQVLAGVRSSLAGAPRPAYVVVTGSPDLARTVEECGFEPVDVDELGWMTRGVFSAV
jgi:SAM-dependent methyltransferase